MRDLTLYLDSKILRLIKAGRMTAKQIAQRLRPVFVQHEAPINEQRVWDAMRRGRRKAPRPESPGRREND